MQIKVTYRRTSRLSMRVSKTGDLLVSAPYHVPESEVEQFIRNNELWIVKALAARKSRVAARQQFYGRLPLASVSERRQAVERLAAIVEPLIERYAPLMKVAPSGVQYKKMISKWGSCDTTARKLTFSLYLPLLPHHCIEHVVVHELAHLVQANHSPAFHAVVAEVMPDWKERKKRLREAKIPE